MQNFKQIIFKKILDRIQPYDPYHIILSKEEYEMLCKLLNRNPLDIDESIVTNEDQFQAWKDVNKKIRGSDNAPFFGKDSNKNNIWRIFRWLV